MLYDVDLPRFKDDMFYMANVEGIEKLKRLKLEVCPFWWPVVGSFRVGTYLHYAGVVKCGQYKVAAKILQYLRTLSQHQKKYYKHNYYDDFYRQHLKRLSNFAFEHIDEDTGYMLLMHMNELGGKAPYRKSDITNDIKNWVVGVLDNMPREFVNDYLDSLFVKWSQKNKDDLLSFEQFATDPMRWATGGGAPRTESTEFGINNEKPFRTKWAWALSRVYDFKNKRWKPDGFERIMSDGASKIANVALKEEASKTREIIGTPMNSYIRQCYLIYCRNKIHLDSPISNPYWLQSLMRQLYLWYGCIDGDNFDKTIPSWIIVEIISRMGDSDLTSEVAREEVAELHQLLVKWGKKEFKWQHGLLSGWRITSLVGSIVSDMVASFIKKYYSVEGAINSGELGDDLVMYSNTTHLTKEELVASYEKFGLKASMRKTISGKIGEFLRKIYCGRGVLGYPARGVKSIVYSPPWLERFESDQLQEVCHGFYTWLSRLTPHALNIGEVIQYVQGMAVDELHRKTLISKKDLIRYINTPVQLGGGGVLETFNGISTSIEVQYSGEDADRLLMNFGIKKYEPVRKVMYKKNITDYRILFKCLKDVNVCKEESYGRIRNNVNITRCVLEWWYDRSIPINELPRKLGIRIPRSLKQPSKNFLLDFVLGINENTPSVTSLYTDASFFQNPLSFLKNINYAKLNKKGTHSFYSNFKSFLFMISAPLVLGKEYPYVTW